MSDPKQTTPPHAGDGGSPAVCVTGLCGCAADFLLDAPCRIIKKDGGSVQMSAHEMPGITNAGTYVWTTASAKIMLTGANSSTLTVVGLAQPSGGRDAEIITVTRTSPGCPPIVKTVKVTVAAVTFSASPSQRYGYDNFDTPANPLDDHVCIKTSDFTFLKVDILGGALGTDFDFACGDPSVCTPVAPGAAASFDLRLNAGAKDHNETRLEAKVKCTGAAPFSNIQVHVYKEILVDVVVAKIVDTAAHADVHRPAMDPAAHTATVNGKVKEAVVKYNITNYDAANAVTNVAFDIDGNGALSYDINVSGGPEVDAIAAAMTGTGTKTRIAVVKKLKSYYYLSEAVAIGATTLKLRGGTAFNYAAFPNVSLGLGAQLEPVTVTGNAAGVLTIAAGVSKAHAVGEPIEYIAAGWASDPIIITEESPVDGSLIAENVVLWTIAHESGHRVLTLKDIVDQTDFMNYQQSWTDYRLRYCPRTLYHGAGGSENQWETIPR